MKLSEKVLYLRKEKGWSQEHLASKLDVSRQAVYKWEAGLALPEIDKIKKLSDIFNITYDNLMNDEISLPIIDKEASSKEQSNNDDAEIEITAPSEEGCSCKAEEKKEGVPCPRCGFIEADSSAFCSECGHSLLNSAEKSPDIKMPTGGFCTSCGAVLSSDSLFCMECGTAVADMKIPEKSEIDASAQKKRSKKPLIITLIVILSAIFISGTVLASILLFSRDDRFLVTFVSDGETVDSEKLTNGDIISDDYSLTKNGYIFKGWSQSQNGQVDYQVGDAIVSSGDLCLYAVWTPIEYSITYVLDGGTCLTNPLTYTVEDSIILDDPVRDGFKFVGWYKDEEMVRPFFSDDLKNGGNITIYAKWNTSDFAFTFLGNGYCITEYTGRAKNITIPSTYNGYPVTSISSHVFLNNTIVERIHFPKETISITASAFNGCTSLNYISVSSNNPNYKSESGVLYSKDGTCIVKYPQGKSETRYTVFSTVTRVGFCSFNGAKNLQTVHLGSNVETIDDRAFEDCTSLKSIYLTGCDTLTFICDESFKKCWALEEISLSSTSLRQIGKNAFEECLSLKSITLPDSIYEICDSAFKKCSSLESLSLKKVEVLGSNVFESSGITRIFIPITAQSIGSNLFLSCENAIVLCEATQKQTGWMTDWSNGASAVFFGKSSGSNVAQFTFEKNGTGTVKLTSCIGSGIVSIPEQYDYFYVTEIADNAFSGQSEITEVHISKRVTTIGETAFNNCSGLEKIFVDEENKNYYSYNGVIYTKDKSSVIRCPEGSTLTTISLSSSCKSIAPYAFYNCKNLKSVWLSDLSTTSGTKTIGKSAFENCTGLSSINLGYLLSTFEENCFKGCTSLGALTVRCESVSKIGSNAFRDCTNLRSIDFDGAIELIDSYAFSGCTALATVDLGSPRNIATKAFENCKSLTKILIPGGVEVISVNAFTGCTKLIAYCFANQKPLAWEQGWDFGILAVVWGAHSIPSSENDFSYTGSGSTATITGCTNAGIINIPQTINGKTVIAIGAGAFSNLYGITEIVIPATVKTIDISAFENCFDLQKITYEGSPTYFGSIDGVLYGDNNKLLLKYPEGKTDESFTVPTRVDIIKSSAFKNNKFIKHITLPDEVGSDNYVGKIEAYAFYGCTSLESINLGHVNYFERECFKNCQSLKSVTFEAENVWGIGNDAFLGCTSLESVTFLGNVSEIGYQCFEACASLESVQFAKNCDKLSSRAFSNCTSLKEIALPANLAAIHTEAFFACTSLEKVTMSSTITKIESDAFKSCVLLKEIYLHKEITSIGKGAFSGCVSLTIKCEADLLPSGYEDGWCDDLSKVILNASKS